MGELFDLGVVETAAMVARREVSVSELIAAYLERIDRVDGTHSHEGDPGSINAWVRVYADDAIEAAANADQLIAAGGELPPLLGVPIGLKDLYGVAGKPVTASSRLLADVPAEDCEVWRRLRAAGMVLLGHLHTHEFAAGGTTDQVGSPWDLARSAGGSSGGSAAALTSRTTPAATGTDTAGSLRIPSACCGTSTIKPTRGLVPTTGIVPLSWSLDHAGPMARSLADCRLLLAAMAPGHAPGEPVRSMRGARIAISPRVAGVELDPDVAAGFEHAVDACRQLGATVLEVPAPAAGFDAGDAFVDVLSTDMVAYHRRFDDRREGYRPSLREWVELGEAKAISGERYASALAGRTEMTTAWSAWFDAHDLAAVIEPTIPNVAPLRGIGYQHAGSDYDMISLTYFWNWTGFPATAFPSGIGRASGLPVSASLIGPAGSDWQLLDLGIELQRLLGVLDPPAFEPAGSTN